MRCLAPMHSLAPTHSPYPHHHHHPTHPPCRRQVPVPGRGDQGQRGELLRGCSGMGTAWRPAGKLRGRAGHTAPRCCPASRPAWRGAAGDPPPVDVWLQRTTVPMPSLALPRPLWLCAGWLQSCPLPSCQSIANLITYAIGTLPTIAVPSQLSIAALALVSCSP